MFLIGFFYGEIDIYLLDKEYLKERIAFHKVKFQESLSLTERISLSKMHTFLVLPLLILSNSHHAGENLLTLALKLHTPALANSSRPQAIGLTHENKIRRHYTYRLK